MNQKIAQDTKYLVSRLIMIDINDPEILSKYPFAGYILFYKDIDQNESGWRNLIEKNKFYENIYKSKFSTNLFRAIDQEGGIVFRFDYDEFPAICSQYSIRNLDDAYKLAKLNGSILKYLNFNLNFSPVMDVNTNKYNPIIGVRSFKGNHENVSVMSKRFVEAYNEIGIVCTGKHFPGHGDTDKDSHLELPVSILTEEHIYPFLQNKNILPSIMTAHVVYKNYDCLPATLSAKLLDLYKPYDGIIFSDALNMKALSQYKWEEVLVKSLEAGVDILLILGDDNLKIESIDFLAHKLEKDQNFKNLVINKYIKIQKYLQNVDLYEYSENLLNQIADLKSWMISNFSNLYEEKGNRNLLKTILTDKKLNIFIISSDYLNLIGIPLKIIEILRQMLVDFSIDLRIVTQIDQLYIDKDVLESFNVVINLLTDADSFVESLRKVKKDFVIFSFSNPYLEGEYVVNFWGFSGIHLRSFRNWIKKELI